MYVLHANIVGQKNNALLNNATWYYESGSTSTEMTDDLCSGQSGYNCSIGSGVLINQNNGSYNYTLAVTWNGETITSGVLSQSNNNGDHKYRFYLCYNNVIERNRYHIVTGMCSCMLKHMMASIFLSSKICSLYSYCGYKDI